MKGKHTVKIGSNNGYSLLEIDGVDFSDAVSFQLKQDASGQNHFPLMTITFPVDRLEGVKCAMITFDEVSGGGGG